MNFDWLTTEAVQKVSDIATHINNHIKQHENFQKMLSIQKCFDKSAPKILTPGREFIKEGILKKVLNFFKDLFNKIRVKKYYVWYIEYCV